jgi:hypothetical protein
MNGFRNTGFVYIITRANLWRFRRDCFMRKSSLSLLGNVSIKQSRIVPSRISACLSTVIRMQKSKSFGLLCVTDCPGPDGKVLHTHLRAASKPDSVRTGAGSFPFFCAAF